MLNLKNIIILWSLVFTLSYSLLATPTDMIYLIPEGYTGGLFIFGWFLQFIGHYFEGKPTEFFKDWRFLLVGFRWWFAKMRW